MIGLATANPALRFSQRELYDFYVQNIPISEPARHLLERLMLQNQSIGFRYLGMDRLQDAVSTCQDELIGRFKTYGLQLAVEAAQQALEAAGLTPAEIDCLVVNSCTGYLCPGLTSYVAEALALRKNIRAFDLMGMGCGGALPALDTACNFLQAHAGANALTISVEICSATLFFSDEPDILVSNSIFGDGAAATVLTSRLAPAAVRLRGFAAGLFPEYREHLHYTTQESRLKNVLSARVPVIGARCGGEVVAGLLSEHGLTVEQIDHWAVHPGGEKVIEAFARAFCLPDEAVEPSRRILYNYGNMSSASVLYVLDEVLRTRQPAAGDLGVLTSFGAGFTAFAGLLEFGGSGD